MRNSLVRMGVSLRSARNQAAAMNERGDMGPLQWAIIIGVTLVVAIFAVPLVLNILNTSGTNGTQIQTQLETGVTAGN